VSALCKDELMGEEGVTRSFASTQRQCQKGGENSYSARSFAQSKTKGGGKKCRPKQRGAVDFKFANVLQGGGKLSKQNDASTQKNQIMDGEEGKTHNVLMRGGDYRKKILGKDASPQSRPKMNSKVMYDSGRGREKGTPINFTKSIKEKQKK